MTKDIIKTPIEALLVIAIIALLIALAIPLVYPDKNELIKIKQECIDSGDCGQFNFIK